MTREQVVTLEAGDVAEVIDVLQGMGVTVTVTPDFDRRTVTVQVRISHGAGSSSWDEHEHTYATPKAPVPCPACGQVITVGASGTECGGDGEGVCCDAAYAFDVLTVTAPMWEGEGEPPTAEQRAAIRAAHDAVYRAIKGEVPRGGQ